MRVVVQWAGVDRGCELNVTRELMTRLGHTTAGVAMRDQHAAADRGPAQFWDSLEPSSGTRAARAAQTRS